jgi:ABC-type Fe3+/spermidine/putrescine transport system ATPase subunit
MSAIKLQQISKAFQDRPILNHVSLSIEDGARAVLSGPSGCGKTTLLRIVSGLEIADTGSVYLADTCVAQAGRNLVAPEKRGIGMVFQDLALWPHMTATQHLEFALRYSGIRLADQEALVRHMLELVQLYSFGSAKPHALSGGQQQRLALARALVGRPRIVLMDEPLSNLDAELKNHLQSEILRLHSILRFTLLYVTHDREEAGIIGSRVITMREGAIVDG